MVNVSRAHGSLCLAAVFAAVAACAVPNPAYHLDQQPGGDGGTADGRFDLSSPFDAGSDGARPADDLLGPPLPGDGGGDTIGERIAEADALATFDLGVADAGDLDLRSDAPPIDLMAPVIDAGGGQRDVTPDVAMPPPDAAMPDSAPVDTATGGGDAASTRVGLVGYWPFDEGTGVTARDVSSLGNHGVLRAGAGWDTHGFPALFPNPACLQLDGVDDEVQPTVAGLPDIGAPKTISLWAWFPAPLPSGVRKNLFAFSRFTDMVGIQFGFDSGRAAVWFRGDAMPFLASAILPEQKWYHLAYVYNGTVHLLYVNGVSVATSNIPSDVGVATAMFFGSYGGSTQLFPGRIDDIRFYDRPLAPAEIVALAQGR
jgi:hypothetical protein